MTQTIFVVGAGASSEVGLPIGYALRDDLSKRLNIRYDFATRKSGDALISDSITRHAPMAIESNRYFAEARRISDALPYSVSIDNLLDSHRENEELIFCGKLGITRAILEAESKSSLKCVKDRHPEAINPSMFKDTWYTSFFKLLSLNCDRNEIENRLKSVILVIFNYDRCIEHFLYHALQTYYGIGPEEAASLISNIVIYHPYGQVGYLPWMGCKEGSIAFGGELTSDNLLLLAGQIKTFTEGTNSDSDQRQIADYVRMASKVIFLGFAFHELNMRVLEPGKSNDAVQCFASTYGFSESDRYKIQDQITTLLGGHVELQLVDLKCNELFKHYSKSLAI